MSERWYTVKRWIWRGSKVVVLLAIAFGFVYWLNFARTSVTRHRVERGPIIAEVMGTGTLEAHVKAVVSSKISGRIDEVLADQGVQVKRGQLLVRLDDEELKQQVAIAQAGREVAQSAIARLKTDKDRAKAVFEQARKNSNRVEALLAKNATSRDEWDRAVEALAVAQAGLSRADAAITEGEKELAAADKTLEYHRARLADTEIKAPFDGLIIRRQRDPGDVVVPGSSILSLISTGELWISAWVGETEMAGLQENQKVRVVFRSEPNRNYWGEVVRLGKEADRETREFVVDVSVLELPRNWAVGMRSEVYIETARKDSVTLLPAKYVVWHEDRPSVFIDREGRAERRPLTLGVRASEMVEVVEGLEAGETVVVPTDSSNRLSDGQRIGS